MWVWLFNILLFIVLNKVFKGFRIRILLQNCVVKLGLNGIKKEEVRAPKGVIDDAIVVKIQSDTAKVVPQLARPSQPRPGTAHDRINHMEQYLQSQFTYLNQYQHSMVQYMQNSNQA